jgi:hypothetical protein
VIDMRSTRWRILATGAALALSAGCTGTDLLDSGNHLLTIEVVLQGTTQQSWECVNQVFQSIRVRPLDGQCSPASANPGDPCLTGNDCPGGDCEGSSATGTTPIPESGIDLLGPKKNFNLVGPACSPTFGLCEPTSLVACQIGQPCAEPGDACQPQSKYQASAFQIAPVVLPAGLYEISSLELGTPVFYDYATGQVLGEGGPCFNSTGASELALLLGKPRFTVAGSGSEVVRLLLDMPALEIELASTCDFFGKAPQFLSVE